MSQYKGYDSDGDCCDSSYGKHALVQTDLFDASKSKARNGYMPDGSLTRADLLTICPVFCSYCGSNADWGLDSFLRQRTAITAQQFLNRINYCPVLKSYWDDQNHFVIMAKDFIQKNS